MGATLVSGFPISYRDLSAMLSDRGVMVDHTTLFHWVQIYAAKLEQRVRRYLRPCTGSWRVDEPYIKVKGVAGAASAPSLALWSKSRSWRAHARTRSSPR